MLDSTEQLPSPRNIAGSIIEIGQGVPLPEVMKPEAFGRRGPFEQLDGATQVTLVGQGPGGDDAPLGHQFGRWRGLAKLVPQRRHRVVSLHGPIAVGQHRVLVVGTGDGPERLELARRLTPPFEPIEAEPMQLADRGSPRRFDGQLRHHATGVHISLALERPPGVVETTLEPLRPLRPCGPHEFLANILREPNRQRPTLFGMLASTNRTFCGRSQRSLVDPLFRRPVVDRSGRVARLGPLRTTGGRHRRTRLRPVDPAVQRSPKPLRLGAIGTSRTRA